MMNTIIATIMIISFVPAWGLRIVERQDVSTGNDILKESIVIEAALVDSRQKSTIIVFAQRVNRSFGVVGCSAQNIGKGKVKFATMEQVGPYPGARLEQEPGAHLEIGNPHVSLEMGEMQYLSTDQSIQLFCEFDGELPTELGTIQLDIRNTQTKQTDTLDGPLVEPMLSKLEESDDFALGSCTGIMFGTPGHIDFWIKYQTKLGVHGTHMYSRSDEDGLPTHIRESIRQKPNVELYEWPSPPWKSINVYAQQEHAVTHCVLRGANRYKWILVSDTDEFLQLGPQFNYGSVRELLEKTDESIDDVMLPRHPFKLDEELSQFKSCEEEQAVTGKSIVNTRRFIRMNAHKVQIVLGGAHGKTKLMTNADGMWAHIREGDGIGCKMSFFGKTNQLELQDYYYSNA